MSALPLLEYGESLAARKEKGWREKAPSNAAKLRALLADGQWHDMAELQAVAGYRYGARKLEIERGQDGGPPLLIEKEPVDGDSSHWRYRAAGPAPAYVAPPECVRPKCQACGQEVPAEVTP